MSDVKAAVRTLELFEAFAEAKRPIPLLQLATRLGLPKSSCFALVGTLAARGYLYEIAPRAGYYPTRRLTTIILGPDERDQPDSRSVRIATMHRAKGLELDEVVLLIPRNWTNVRSGADNSRQLKYVAMTRAKRVATIVEY